MQEPIIHNDSNEKIIRDLIKQYLIEQYNSQIFEEFTHFSLNTRNDVMGISEQYNLIISVEIKSDRDTLKRLINQVNEYKLYSDIVLVVVDKKHLKNIIKLQIARELDDVGIMVYSSVSNSLSTIQYHKVLQNPLGMFEYLWSHELMMFLKYSKNRSKIAKNINNLQRVILKHYEPGEIKQISNLIFIHRDGFNKSANYPSVDVLCKKLIL
ncbi:MAG: sce7726 family protein [Sphaerochaeta sp.]